MSIQTHLADFYGYPIEIIDHQGKPWLTGEQVGVALGMKHARTGIHKIYKRHADEFTPEMTCVVDMDTKGQSRQVRIFSPRGAHMLGMWSQTEKAKLFRQWVLDVLEKATGQQTQAQLPPASALPAPGTITVDQGEYIDLLKDKIRLLEDLNVVRIRRNFTDSEKEKIRELVASGKNMGEIGRAIGRSKSGVRSYLKREGISYEC